MDGVLFPFSISLNAPEDMPQVDLISFCVRCSSFLLSLILPPILFIINSIYTSPSSDSKNILRIVNFNIDNLRMRRYTYHCKGVTCNPAIIAGISENHNRSSPENEDNEGNSSGSGHWKRNTERRIRMTPEEMCRSCKHAAYCMAAYRKDHWCGNHTGKEAEE